MNGPEPSVFALLDARLTQDSHPSFFFAGLGAEQLSQYPMNLLGRLKQTPQSPKHHPEGNVWNHTMLVVDAAAQRRAQSSNPQALLWAALLHDIGKPATTRTRRGRITSYDHDKVGAGLAREFLLAAGGPEALARQVEPLVRWHMQLLFVTGGLPFADIKGMKAQVNLHEVALLGLCDRLGRLGADPAREQQNIRLFLQKCGLPPLGERQPQSR